MNNLGYAGQQSPTDTTDEFNATRAIAKALMSRMSTCTLVKIVSVTNSGGLSPVGFVDVQPLVNQIDGAGQSTPHGILHHLPYFRLQGGTNAVILDPVAGDIGICVFADHDISSAVNAKAQANPGSKRRFDMADGLYIGGVLNGTPVQYVQFTVSGINVVSPTAITIKAPAITLDGPVTATSTINAATSVTAPQVTGSTNVTFGGKSGIGHVHSGVQTGAGNTGAPV